MVRIYKLKQFNLYSNISKDGFIIHNTNKEFKSGHTHINNCDTAKYLIKLAFHESVPYHLPVYYIDSLIRISENQSYINRLKNLKKKELKKKNK